jgi:hypothetical protein
MSSGYALRDVEDGFARVVNAAGRPVGQVARDKRGSTRTGTQWNAKHRVYGDLGWKDTRAEAVKLVTDKQDELAAKMAARQEGSMSKSKGSTVVGVASDGKVVVIAQTRKIDLTEKKD